MGGDVSFLGEVIPVEEVRSRPPFWYGIPTLADSILLLVDGIPCLGTVYLLWRTVYRV